LFSGGFNVAAISVFSAVFAHCYSPWLKFSGGRGLATAAGGLLLFIPMSVAIWIITWLISFSFSKKNIHIGNVAATVLTPFIMIMLMQFYTGLSFPEPESSLSFIIFVLIIFLTILSKHIKPMIDLLSPNKKANEVNNV
jgi:glycerol-3-phosphate acyltransferase PlsY